MLTHLRHFKQHYSNMLYVIKVHGHNVFFNRKPYKLVNLQNATTYRSPAAAKSAIRNTLPIYLKGLTTNALEIREVKLTLI